jgi:hypothetical protein
MNNYIQKIKNFLKKFFHDPLFLKYWESPYSYPRQNDNQLSVRVMGSNRGRNIYSGDPFMFTQDMYMGIMPFMHQVGEREKYPTRIEPNLPQVERIIADGISGRGYHNSLADALCDFVRTSAQVLFQDGVVLYEIVYKKNATGHIEDLGMVLLQPYYLFRLFRNYYQFIPWWEAKRSQTSVRIIRIPKEKVLRIDFPKSLGGKRKINKILKRLSDLSKELIPKFQMEALERNKSIGFDMEEFSRLKYLEIAQMTKDLGWNQRQRSDNYITEYYSMTRYLREKKAEVIVRDTIISKLNSAFNRDILGFGVQIIMDNLLSIEKIEEQEKHLKNGNVVFIDIFNALKI